MQKSKGGAGEGDEGDDEVSHLRTFCCTIIPSLDKEVLSQVKREKKTVTFKLEPEFEGQKGSDSSEGHDTDNKEVWLVRLPNTMSSSSYCNKCTTIYFKMLNISTHPHTNMYLNPTMIH